MAGRKITQLPTLTTPTATDKLVIVDVSDTSESPQGTSKQIAVGDLNAIPLSGTETGSPLTGTIEMDAGIKLTQTTIGDDLHYMGFNEDGDYGIQVSDEVVGHSGRIVVTSAGGNISSFDSVDGNAQIFVGRGLSNEAIAGISTTKFGIFTKANDPSPQAAAIADPTDLASLLTALPSLLAAMRAYGFIDE
jgi:hypothetical protein